MALLNKMAYTVEKDKLVYDAKHPIDATAVQVTVGVDADGILRRGQLLDCENGVYSIHSEGGMPSAIIAEDTEYASEDMEIIVPVYISGTFRASEVITEPEITVTDIENLRSKGIYLK
ncbi:MAG: hypothetical protein HFH74_09235 [Lachnospiraceae bacterium]|nr:hypothetical protein [Lachnospiraceae bacterium]